MSLDILLSLMVACTGYPKLSLSSPQAMAANAFDPAKQLAELKAKEANEDFVGAGDNSSSQCKLCTYVRPEYLRVVCDDSVCVADSGEFDFQPHTYVDLPPLELLSTHHPFDPVGQPCRRASVQIARPIRVDNCELRW